MAVRIGHASGSETGSKNGAKGDSTKNEVCIRSFYNGNWDFVAIHPDEDVRRLHAEAVEDACYNDNIGYGQNDRNTLNTAAKAVSYRLAKVKTKCNCDCSSLQNVAAIAAGTPKVTYGSNGWTTHIMKTKLKSAGYKIIEDKTYLTSASYCVKGAIYVRAGHHTICALDNGSKHKKTLEKVALLSSPNPKVVVATDPAASKDSDIAGKYVVTATALHLRNGVGTNKKSMVILPKDTVVTNYGYYTKATTGVKWLYVQVSYNGVKYTGFCSSKWLKKK